MRTIARAAVLAALIAAPAFAQPSNDSCAAAQAISGYGTFPFNNTAATTDGLANGACMAFGTAQIERDVWYCWTSAWSGPVSANTCGQTTVDTRIAVYEGCACFKGSGIIACSDDACDTQSRVTWIAELGQTYLIRVGSYPGALGGTGTFTIESGILGGPLVNPGNQHIYYILHPSTWTQAHAAAQAIGGDLATINDAAENEWVRAELGNFKGQDRRVWIGLNDVAVEGQFVWTSGQPVTYTNWDTGEPNNTGGLEHYVELFGSTGEWNDNTDNPKGLTVYGAVEMPDTCYADCNTSTTLTIADFACFQMRFVNGDPWADCNMNGTLTIADFACFQAKFVAGCP